MAAAEVRLGHAVDDRARRSAELAFENLACVRAGDRMHRIEAHAKAPALQHRADALEVEQPLHQRRVVGDRIDHLDAQAAELGRFDAGQIDRRRVDRQVTIDLLRARIDRLGDLLGRRPAIGDVVLDAEVTVGSAGVVTRRKNDPAVGGATADHIARGGRGQKPVAADQHARVSVRGRHAQDDLDRFDVEVAPVATEHQCLALDVGQHVEKALHETLDVARLLEHRNLLAQARCAGTLTGKRR